MKTSSRKRAKTANGTPKVKGKKFSKAVTENKPMLWDQGLEFDGSILPLGFQKTLLKDWLLSDRTFEEVCQMHGLTEEETLSLKEKLPQNVIALKERQVTENFSLVGRSTSDEFNRQAILTMISRGLRFSRRAEVMADVKFMDGSLTPTDLGKFVSQWAQILRGIGAYLTKPELDEEKGFRALMDMTREELGDLKKRIQEYRHYKLDIPEAEVVLGDDEEKVGK